MSSLEQHVDGTCLWALQTPQYQQWARAAETSLLWISGHAGSGKTILSSYIIKALWSGRAISKGNPTACCFFFHNGLERQRDAKAFLCSIIFQILTEYPHLVRHVMPALEFDKDGANLLQSYDSLWSLFTAIISDAKIGPICIIIDALDECEKTSSSRLMKAIARLIDESRPSTSQCIKYLITSRPHSMINEYFDVYEPQRLRLEDAQNGLNEDLQLVIRQRMKKIAKRTKAKEKDISELEQFLNQNADRSFLWATLNLDMLDRELSTATRDYRKVLAGVPRTLGDTYKRLILGIEPEWADFARTLFRIILASFRPLSLDEINILISTHEATRNRSDLAGVEEHLRPNIELDINRVLKSLVRISDSRLYLVHISLKEFLCPSFQEKRYTHTPQQDHIDLRRANLFLASACMAYLSLEDFSGDLYLEAASCHARKSIDSSQKSETTAESVDGSIRGNIVYEYQRLDAERCARVAQQYPLFAYAARFWAEHFGQSQDIVADKSVHDIALHLSDIRPQHQSSNWFRFFSATRPIIHDNPANFDPLAIAGYFGLFTSMEIHLSRADNVRMESLAHALYWASRMGHVQCVDRLLKTNVVPDSWTVVGQNALCGAADMGHLEIVEALATDSRVNINFRGSGDGTPLTFAAGSGHVEVVQFFLSNKHNKWIEADAEDCDGETPLHRAIFNDHVAVARVLVEDPRVNINHLDTGGETPFYCAATAKGSPEMVEMLLTVDEIDVDSPSVKGRTPLAEASRNGRYVLIERLKRRKRLNISHSHRESNGRNAISLAAQAGHDSVIKLLHDCKVPGIDEEDISGRTPLFWALEAPTGSTVKTLLDSGMINVNHQDESGRTALSRTVTHGNVDILRVLLEEAAGLETLLPDKEGLTPLDWARRTTGSSETAGILEGFLSRKR